jgi:hypothetical protein
MLKTAADAIEWIIPAAIVAAIIAGTGWIFLYA